MGDLQRARRPDLEMNASEASSTSLVEASCDRGGAEMLSTRSSCHVENKGRLSALHRGMEPNSIGSRRRVATPYGSPAELTRSSAELTEYGVHSDIYRNLISIGPLKAQVRCQAPI